MWAMVVKEFRQLRRDRRTLAMMIILPILLLVIYGYAASFDVSKIPTAVVGRGADELAERIPEPFRADDVRPDAGREDAEEILRRGEAVVAVVVDEQAVLVDGSSFFSARSAVSALGRLGVPRPEILFNPELRTPAWMVPGLIGLILVFVGMVATSLGVVRERQAGTLEQLAVMPFRPRDIFLGKVAPYFGVAVIDIAIIAAAGLLLFDVPFNGSVPVFALGSLLFLFVALGMGVLVSSVSQTQGQAIQLAILLLLPQVLLSGLIFPLESMGVGVRWIGYILPLTYFVEISRGIMLRGAPLVSLWVPLTALTAMGLAVFGLAVIRFRRDLAPAGPAVPEAGPEEAAVVAAEGGGE